MLNMRKSIRPDRLPERDGVKKGGDKREREKEGRGQVLSFYSWGKSVIVCGRPQHARTDTTTTQPSPPTVP